MTHREDDLLLLVCGLNCFSFSSTLGNASRCRVQACWDELVERHEDA